jgi:hypothetical protein
VQEIWRRIYIQNWDYRIAALRGVIKYDASQPHQTFGPFREGLGYSPYWIDAGGRTLPIEYFTDESHTRQFRDNYVKEKYRAAGNLAAIPFDDAFYTPPPDGSVPDQGLTWRNSYVRRRALHPPDHRVPEGRSA